MYSSMQVFGYHQPFLCDGVDLSYLVSSSTCKRYSICPYTTLRLLSCYTAARLHAESSEYRSPSRLTSHYLRYIRQYHEKASLRTCLQQKTCVYAISGHLTVNTLRRHALRQAIKPSIGLDDSMVNRDNHPQTQFY